MGYVNVPICPSTLAWPPTPALANPCDCKHEHISYTGRMSHTDRFESDGAAVKKNPNARARFRRVFSDSPVLPEETFRDHGIEDGARLYVSHTVPSVEQIVTELLVLNPGLSRHRATRQNEGKGVHRVDPQNPLGILGSWDLDHLGLASLPDSLIIDGDLLLLRNQLSSLPRDFGEISVGGSLDLSHNRIESLPASCRRCGKQPGSIACLTPHSESIFGHGRYFPTRAAAAFRMVSEPIDLVGEPRM